MTYAPYVADYSRYLPSKTSGAAAFWTTFGGSVISSQLAMTFGALVAALGANFVKNQVGFMGELVAFDWLSKRYGSTCLWRSHYRRHVIKDGDIGNDDLGFDIEVLRERRGPLMYEVKATTTDDMAFDLSEREIAVAQANAGHDRYRILFVGRVNDSENRWVSVLPNPLSAQGRGRYRIIGRGIRYEFASNDIAIAVR